MKFLTRKQIKEIGPDPLRTDRFPLNHARAVARRTGIQGPAQQFGTRWAIGCVALEVTQRCNLDCTLCYLSDSAEAVHDIPMVEIYRRIELIRAHYGECTDVQITGGDPTLRRRSELVEIVHRIRAAGLRPTLMTNGIKATRELLAELQEAGLLDVVFHVDTTQDRAGCHTEEALNAVREKYIGRARGLGLSVLFNTTVHHGNMNDIPALVRFFRRHSDVVSLASFQLQADTGRGVWGRRDPAVTADAVAPRIELGADTPLNFESIQIGHPECTRFAMCLSINGNLHDLLDNADLAGRIQQSTSHIEWDRARPRRTVYNWLKWLGTHPLIAARVLSAALRRIPLMLNDLVAGRFKVRKLSFVIHDFMDACALDPQRIEACVFKNMTADGPLSMCLCNAKRDDYLLRPLPVGAGGSQRYWDPLDGRLYTRPPPAARFDADRQPIKRLKGRARATALRARAPLKNCSSQS